ncbi:MAG: sigma-70 family RNA polymerase sigma factor [Pseudomonadota bacterium]
MDEAVYDKRGIQEAAEYGGATTGAPTPTQDARIDHLCKSYLKDLSKGLRDRFGDGPPDPEDVAQEAFRRLIERGDTRSIKNLKAFLWRTARNLVFDDKKMSSIRSKYDLDIEQIFFSVKGDNSSPETVILAREQLKAVNALLRDMPEKRRRALILYRIEGLTLVEVSRRLRISRTAVSKHIARAQIALNALCIEDADG